jgi:hypothetical protein
MAWPDTKFEWILRGGDGLINGAVPIENVFENRQRHAARIFHTGVKGVKGGRCRILVFQISMLAKYDRSSQISALVRLSSVRLNLRRFSNSRARRSLPP